MKPQEKEKEVSAPLNEQNFLNEQTVIAYINRSVSYPRSEWPAIWRPPTFKPIQKGSKDPKSKDPKAKKRRNSEKKDLIRL